MKIDATFLATGGGYSATVAGASLRVEATGSRWAWTVTGGLGKARGEADTAGEAQAAAVDWVQRELYPQRKRAVSRGGSAISGRGLEGAIEAQAATDAAAGRCWLWRVPSPPPTGADASARAVDFFGVLPGGRAVAIEAKEGATPSFKVERLTPAQADILRAVDAAGGLAGLVVELRGGRRWWVPWASLADRVGGGGCLGGDWMSAHAVEMSGADWLAAAVG